MAIETFVRGRFTALLLALISLVVATPLVEQVGGVPWIVLDILFTAMILALLYAMSAEPHFPILAMVLALPALGTRWGLRVTANEAFVVASFGLQIAFLAVSMGVVLLEILRSERVTTDTVLGGISVYLLIGITFAMLYGLIDYLDPAAFSLPSGADATRVRLPGRDGFAELVYFSFVTQTTLGYGDVVPLATGARSLSALQAVTGQIYLAVFVARLIGLHLVHHRPGPFEP